MKRKSYSKFATKSLLALALAVTTTNALGGTEPMAVAPMEAESGLDWLTVSGYAALAYTYTDNGTETFTDGNTPFDAVKVGFAASYGQFSAYTSLFYTPNITGDDAGILDAYITYTSGPYSITAGKYLSYLGYEAFDAVNMLQISYANAGVGAIPAYHNGIKLDYAGDVISAGLSISDSIRGGTGFWTGDEDFSDGLGYEGYVSYKGIDKLTVFAGIGFEDSDTLGDWVTYNLWSSYDLSDKITFAGELAYNDNGVTSGIQALALMKYTFTDKFYTVLRVGYDDVNGAGGPQNIKYTVGPSYSFCESFLVRAEVSYLDYEADDAFFGGVQAMLKF